MLNLLFVCLGNICRSPAAETIMNQLLKAHHLNHNVTCDSAGLTATFIGKFADATMRKIANDRNYNITHIARIITNEDFEKADFILTMDDNMVAELQSITPNKKYNQKIQNICDYCEYYPDNEVIDPYGGDNEEFEFVLDLLEDACHGLLSMVKRQIN